MLNKTSSRTKAKLPKAPRQSTDVVSRLTQHVADFLKNADISGKTILLALSGGMDSCVLLDLFVNVSQALPLQSETAQSFQLQAMHVHHGLSPNADAWATFCLDLCAQYKTPLQIARVQVPKDTGSGIESAARQVRYAALLNTSADYVVLAHHADDQAETFLLQLLRGAGAKGLASMASRDESRRLLRPLLDISHAELVSYATARQLRWVDDESNEDTHYDRNFFRHQVLPILEQRFPAVKTTLARSASHLAEASSLLDDLAQLDAQQCLQGLQLRVDALAQLTPPRARNLLRWWLVSQQQPLPSTQRLQEMLNQLLGAKTDAVMKVAVDSANGVWLRRYQHLAYIEINLPEQPIAMIWQGEDALELPDHSRLLFERKQGSGLAAERLGIKKLRIAHRIGGERFKPDIARPTRTLKHLLQEASIPPWQRERLPLIYCDDALAVVPNIGVASHLQATSDEIGLVITWLGV